MEKDLTLEQRLDVIFQSAEVAQKNGIFSLEEAVLIKTAIDNINSRVDIEESIGVLIKSAETAQKKGAYTLSDAYYIYMSINGIVDLLLSDGDKVEEEKDE